MLKIYELLSKFYRIETHKKGQVNDLSHVIFVRLQIKAEGLQQQVPCLPHWSHTS